MLADNGAAAADPPPLVDAGPLNWLTAPEPTPPAYLFLVASADAAERMRRSLEGEGVVRVAASETARTAWVVAISSDEEAVFLQELVRGDSSELTGALHVQVIDAR